MPSNHIAPLATLLPGIGGPGPGWAWNAGTKVSSGTRKQASRGRKSRGFAPSFARRCWASTPAPGLGATYLPQKSAVFGPRLLRDTSICVSEFAGFFTRSYWHLKNVVIVGEFVLSLGHQQPPALMSPKALGRHLPW